MGLCPRLPGARAAQGWVLQEGEPSWSSWVLSSKAVERAE